MYKEYMDVLNKCELFKGISSDELYEMLLCLSPRIKDYERNNYITIMGSEFSGIGVLMEGEIHLTKEDAAGNRVLIDIIHPGDLFGEMAAFSDKKVWPATAIAQSDCTVMFIQADVIVGQCPKMCSSHRMLIINMLSIVSDKAMNLNKRVEYLSMKSIRSKLSYYLLEQYKRAGKPIFDIPLNRNQLADFLNVTRPSLSREMCHMRDEGIIDFHMSSIRVNNIDELKKAIEM